MSAHARATYGRSCVVPGERSGVPPRSSATPSNPYKTGRLWTTRPDCSRDSATPAPLGPDAEMVLALGNKSRPNLERDCAARLKTKNEWVGESG